MEEWRRFPGWARFETRHQPLLPWRRFGLRILGFFAAALLLDAMTITLGAVGYRHFEHLPWSESFLNAAMILTSNGSVHRAQTLGGKIFQIGYAWVGGILFVAVVSVLLAPVFHRVLHAFSIDLPDEDEEAEQDSQAQGGGGVSS